jgi:hypothetical protein
MADRGSFTLVRAHHNHRNTQPYTDRRREDQPARSAASRVSPAHFSNSSIEYPLNSDDFRWLKIATALVPEEAPEIPPNNG